MLTSRYAAKPKGAGMARPSIPVHTNNLNTMTNLDAFLTTYEQELRKRVGTDPAYGLVGRPADVVDARIAGTMGMMRKFLPLGNINTKGAPALAATCKHFGIACTIKAIVAHVNAPAATSNEAITA